MSDKPNILLVLNWYNIKLHQGVLAFARERQWHLQVINQISSTIPYEWEGDGIILQPLSGHSKM